jgi:hypothetical protein
MEMEDPMGLFARFHTKAAEPGVGVAELRPKGDCYVRMDGADHGIRSWNSEGSLTTPYSGGLIAGQLARVTLVLRDFMDPDGDLRVDDQVVIERIDSQGLRARWWRLPSRKKIEIADYFARKAAKHA